MNVGTWIKNRWPTRRHPGKVPSLALWYSELSLIAPSRSATNLGMEETVGHLSTDNLVLIAGASGSLASDMGTSSLVRFCLNG